MRNFLLVLIGVLSALSAGEASQTGEFLRQLESDDEDVRYNAVIALDDLADPASVDALARRTGDRSIIVRHAAAQALSRIGGRRVEEIFTEMAGSGSVERRRLGVIGLGLIGCSDAGFEVVLKASGDESRDVRWASAFALGQLGDERGYDRLQSLAQDDKSEVRRAAQIGLARRERTIRWRHVLDEALELSRMDARPVVAVFILASTKPCKMMLEFFEQSEIVELSRRLHCVKMNPQTEASWSERFGVSGVPVMLLLGPGGEVRDRLDGAVSYESLLERWKLWSQGEAQSDRNLVEDWQQASTLMEAGRFEEAIGVLEYLQTDAGEVGEVLFYLGYCYGRLGRHSDSVAVLEKLRARRPDFDQMDKALYCLSLSYLATNREPKAVEILELMQKSYGDTPAAQAAAELLRRIRSRNHS